MSSEPISRHRYNDPTLMNWVRAIRVLFDSEHGAKDRLGPRWLFLRSLGGIYFSAFFSLVFQIRGLIGPEGILPAGEYLRAVAHSFGYIRGIWFAPTFLWLGSGLHMVTALCWAGVVASLLLVINVWPRAMLVVCFVCFLSFVSAAQDFSGYQSDGMLLEAGFIAVFFAPAGLRPGFGVASPPSRASLFLLQWEWFRIYFESGVAKIAGGDPEWRHFTAMDEYYQNGPLPTWIGWYMQHLPHWFHASTAFATLALELVLVWMLFLPRRWRIWCFLIVTPWELGVILTANYTFLNYLVLTLGVLLLDDRCLQRYLPQRWKKSFATGIVVGAQVEPRAPQTSDSDEEPGPLIGQERPKETQSQPSGGFGRLSNTVKPYLTMVILGWIFYATTAQLMWMFSVSLPTEPVVGCRALSHRQSIRTLWHHDAGAIRDRVPGFRRRKELGAIPVPLQAAGPKSAPWHLRALSTAIRLEPLVCFVGIMARIPNCSQDRGAASLQRQRRSQSLCDESVSEWAPTPGTRCDLAILVHNHVRKTDSRSMVAPSIHRTVCSNDRARTRWENPWRRMACGYSTRVSAGSDSREFSRIQTSRQTTWTGPFSLHDSHTCHALRHPEESTLSKCRHRAPTWRNGAKSVETVTDECPSLPHRHRLPPGWRPCSQDLQAKRHDARECSHGIPGRNAQFVPPVL